MSSTASSTGGSEGKPTSALTVERYYAELCSNIRATDNISFKLLGFVPLISGAGIVTVLSARQKLQLPPSAVVVVAVLAAIVTLALYRWERRNIDICNWLIACAAEVEREMLVTYGRDRGKLHELAARSSRHMTRDPEGIERSASLREGTTQFLGPGGPPGFLRWSRFGKTQATQVLYGSTVAAWIAVVPITLSC